MATKFSKLPLLNSILIFAVLVFLIVFFFGKNNDPKITYVDNVKLFNSFNMAKELNKSNQAQLAAQGKVVDSVYKNLQVAYAEKKQV